MSKQLSKNLNILIILYVLILPKTVYTIIDVKYTLMYFLSIIAFALILFFIQFKNILNKVYKEELIFVLILSLFSLLTSFSHGNISPGLAIICPITSYLGYTFIRKRAASFNLKLFNLLFLFLYIYFYLIYFSLLPNLFFRPGFDEHAIVFETASSNGIPIILNIRFI